MDSDKFPTEMSRVLSSVEEPTRATPSGNSTNENLYSTEPELVDVMGGKERIEIKVLDRGHAALIDSMPRLVPAGRKVDDRVVQTARVSYGRGLKTPGLDRGLKRYLLRHYHTSPFEMVKFTFHLKMPIFVARQWIRHRMANINEYSGRYSIMCEDFYIPSSVRSQSGDNMQGSGSTIENEDVTRKFYEYLYAGQDLYGKYLDLVENDDVARELGRIGLSVNNYTEFYWTMDLNNLLKFLRLRMDSHSQWEIQEYARAIYQLIKPLVPDTIEAFDDYMLGSITLTKAEVEAIRTRCSSVRGSKREQHEYEEKLEKLGLSFPDESDV